MLLGTEQSHSFNVTEGSTATKWNFIQSDTDPPSKSPRNKGLGPSAPYPELVLGTRQGRTLAESQSCLLLTTLGIG